jgi:hypothetical protein
VWDESNGARGSCEIGSCLLMQINSVSEKNINVREITYYSDTCSGENRNQYVSSALLCAVNKVDNIDAINHKFLEKGNSEMESDSIHGAVEFAKRKEKKKNQNIYTITMGHSHGNGKKNKSVLGSSCKVHRRLQLK